MRADEARNITAKHPPQVKEMLDGIFEQIKERAANGRSQLTIEPMLLGYPGLEVVAELKELGYTVDQYDNGDMRDPYSCTQINW